ncbi:Regulatory protein recX [Nocardia africana]|uniref:Regulatory protein RecX n=2 Tax=Nocardia africana TaxID=134964 RepID=A0A378X190_9NOCA|nr:Regulatory protein recX [Nocardia africana]
MRANTDAALSGRSGDGSATRDSQARKRIRALKAEVDALQRGWGERADGDRRPGRAHRAERRSKGGDSGSFVPDDSPVAHPRSDDGADDGGSRRRSRRDGGDGGGRRGSRRRSDADGGKRSDAAQSAASKAGTEAQAKDICLRLLTDRARSRAELADKLAAKGFAPEVAERALNRLAEVGLIDDAAFAEQWVHSRHTFSGKGKKVLAQELRRKGVSDADAEPALAAITPADESARAAELVRRKLTTLPPDLPTDKTTNRLVSMLARRGYNQSLAYAVVKDELAAVATESCGPDAEHAAQLVRKRLASLSRDIPQDKAVARLVGMLARRGYSQSMAYAVVKEETAAAAQPFAVQPNRTEKAVVAEDSADADTVAAESDNDEAERAAQLVRRKLRTMPRNLSEDKVVNRLIGMLARQGFRQSTAYAAVRAELAHGYPPD